MSKALIINFEDSEEELYKWLVQQSNYEKILKNLIENEINKNSDENVFDSNFFRIGETLPKKEKDNEKIRKQKLKKVLKKNMFKN